MRHCRRVPGELIQAFCVLFVLVLVSTTVSCYARSSMGWAEASPRKNETEPKASKTYRSPVEARLEKRRALEDEVERTRDPALALEYLKSGGGSGEANVQRILIEETEAREGELGLKCLLDEDWAADSRWSSFRFMIKKRLSSLAIERAKSENTIAAFERFFDEVLGNDAASEDCKEASAALEELHWSETTRKATLESYLSYSRNYSRDPSRRVAEARDARVAEARDAVRRFRLEAALEQDSPTALLRFLIEYPDCDEAAQVLGEYEARRDRLLATSDMPPRLRERCKWLHCSNPVTRGKTAQDLGDRTEMIPLLAGLSQDKASLRWATNPFDPGTPTSPREVAAMVLGRNGGAAVPYLLEMLEDTSWGDPHTFFVYCALGYTGVADAVPPLIEGVPSHGAVEGLARLAWNGPPPGTRETLVDVLSRCLWSDDAVRGLKSLGGEKAGSAFLAALKADLAGDNLEEIVTAIGELRVTAAADTLLSLLEIDRMERGVYTDTILLALARIGGPRAYDLLHEHIFENLGQRARHDDDMARALVEIDDPRGTAALLRIMASHNRPWDYCRYLAERGDVSAVPEILKIWEDCGELVSAYDYPFAKCLEQLTGWEGRTATEFREWFESQEFE